MIPRRSMLVEGGDSQLWTCGYEQRHVRVVTDGPVTVTILGSCTAPDAILRRSLRLARTGRWRELARWGSYVTVVRAPGETVVFGDAAGDAMVYFVDSPDGVLWATEATPLAAFANGRPRLELLALDVALSGLDMYLGEVPYESVQAVPPRSLLRIRHGHHEFEPWFEPRPPATFEQAGAGIGEAMIDGVGWRAQLSNPITLDMGGTDSCVIAALAGRQQTAIGYTYVENERSPDLLDGDEIAAGLPWLSRTIVPFAPSMGHYSGLGDPASLPVTDLPCDGLLFLGPDPTILRLAAAAGSTDHMIGIGGDEVLSNSTASLLGLWRSGRRRTAIAATIAAARAARTPAAGPLGALFRAAHTSQAQALRAAATQLRRGCIDPAVEPTSWQLRLSWIHARAAAGWLTPELAQWCATRLETLAEQLPADVDPISAADWRELHRGAARMAAVRAVAAREGITLHLPWHDNRVLEWWAALDGWNRAPDRQFKPLIGAMAGVLPAVVLARKRKDRLGIDRAYHTGVRANAPHLLALARSSRLVRDGIFDGRKVRAAVQRTLADVDRTDRSIGALAALDVWLAQRDLRRGTYWETEEHRVLRRNRTGNRNQGRGCMDSAAASRVRRVAYRQPSPRIRMGAAGARPRAIGGDRRGGRRLGARRDAP
jgi:asparagine synthase (glutamine-hydrolysing)